MKKTEKLIGAGLGLAAVAAAGAYFLYGKDGAKNRKKISGWSLKMKGEVLEKIEQLKEVNRDKYCELVDKVSQKYSNVEKISEEELRRLTVELKNAWSHISKEIKK